MAWKETTHHEAQTPWVKAEMRKKTLFFRWMDDVVHIIDKSISREGRKATRALKKKNFYGKGLDLIPEPGVRRAFGFHWGTAGGVVTCRGLNQPRGKKRRSYKEGTSTAAPSGGWGRAWGDYCEHWTRRMEKKKT